MFSKNDFLGGHLLVVLALIFTGCGLDDSESGGRMDAAVIIPQCTDGVDNDDDGRIDADDPGCENEEDRDESDDPILAQCADGLDNDEDGFTDLDDPACADADDDDESDDPPACSDERDNDGDGDIDYPDDRGCDRPSDPDESGEPELPECSDGEDNDNDGFIDFPADPGCGSEFDTSEGENGGVVLPQCANGLDDDGDGLVDLADPGCSSVADPRESDQEGESPACSNGLDDDADGVIDFPYEPGCSAAGDDDEADPANPPACGNTMDDDSDGQTDYPNDPGCAGIGDRDETDPDVPPRCADGVDNDRDGQTDFPDDRGCASAADHTEAGACGRTYEAVEVDGNTTIRGDSRQSPYASEGSCGGRGAPEVVLLYRVTSAIEAFVVRTDQPGNQLESTIYIRRGCLDETTEIVCQREPVNDDSIGQTVRVDNPQQGDYYIFVDGAAGSGANFEVFIEEVPLAQCLNGIDDDEDGWTDYPLDPGCVRPTDRDETDPDVPPTCFDNADNDGDGLVDYPLDAGCQSAADGSEEDLCGQGLRIFDYPVGDESILTNTANGQNVFGTTCGAAAGPEKVFVYDNPFSAALTISVDHPETIDRTMISVRRSCVDLATEVACDAGEAPNQKGTVDIGRAEPGLYFIIVDHPFGLGGPVKLSIDVERLPPGCSDGVDNDEDGFVDADDLGCASIDDEDERDVDIQPDNPPQCADDIDNDQDGLTDYPNDPGCTTRGTDDEVDPAERPECSNGIDDDEDDTTDYPRDNGCSSAADPDEQSGRRPAQCNNRIDDDQDGFTDYPNDPGCAAFGDLSEQDGLLVPDCADGLDNDRDGLVDFPYDNGCSAAGDNDEREPAVLPACSNGLDDDEDGVIDFPLEPGCQFAADEDETDPNFPPQCANGRDDDQNGRSDFPDDVGCAFAGDTRESSDGIIQPRCSDGVDNDLDGQIDLNDVGCLGSRDNDENDPEVAPFCADGLDNDEDGIVDWPADDGCAALGDECEQANYGFCDALCQPLLDNERHCGRCGRTCAPGTECIDGRCGGVRERVLMCGVNARYRAIDEFIAGEVDERGIVGQQGCQPAADVQAILVNTVGTNSVTAQAQAYLDYIANGGQVITARGNSHTLFSAIFGQNIPRPNQSNGRCAGNIQPVFQLSAGDSFWIDNLFRPIDLAQSGCGYSLSNIPDSVFLGGWDQQNISLAYYDFGRGRIWLVESNWYDMRAEFTQASRDLMISMIMGPGTGGVPPCLDGRDNDEDGLFDFDDPGCTGVDDPEEGDPAEPPACADGIDNDGDDLVDYPWEPGCLSAGDDDESDPAEVPQCNNGLDDDGDGEPDFPFDPGCLGVGDTSERNPERTPRCSNKRDDDGDGLIDFPADPGCRWASDATEEDPAVAAQCSDGVDNDRDGITDWPFDVGCEAAIDNDETDPDELPQCSNRIDDDADGLIDFPNDPGCGWSADPREVVVGDAPVCSNGVDDDGDALIDYPNDRGCRFAGDVDEVDPFDPPSRCEDGVDNDGDGFVDLQDPGCENNDDDDEEDGDEVPLCANEIDDDEDGLIDWPADPGCQAQGDLGESQLCRDGLVVDTIEQNGSVLGRTLEDGDDNFRNRCGGREAPDAVYRYVLQESVERLTFSADNPNTQFPVILSVRRDCEEPRSQLACAGDFRTPEPTVTLEQPDAGEYFVFVDGGGPERWVGSGGNLIAMPADPRGFVARNDFRDDCWSDGGSDAFDCYGRISISHGNQQSQLNVSIGRDKALNVGGYGIVYSSELLGNVWRVTIEPAVDNDERPVSMTVTGNLGSDGGTQAAVHNYAFQGRQVGTFYTTDGVPRDPPITHMLVPSDPEQLQVVNYTNVRDNVTITANNITLPATFYVALSYAERAAVAQALLNDLEIRASAGGPDSPRFGGYELTVTEE